MKVAFTINPDATEGGGSHSFARTLSECLGRHKTDVSFNLLEPADVILVFAHTISIPRLVKQKMQGARIVHRLDEKIEPDETPARREKHAQLRRINRYADWTIFQSEFVKGNVGPFLGNPPGEVILNGVNIGLFRPEEGREKLEGDPAVLHVTWSVGDSKSLHRLEELLNLPGFPDLKLYLVGRHDESSGGGWSGHPRVVPLGKKDREGVAACMRRADLLFFPSRNDPCPNTVLEAMASGLPVLYDSSGGTPELILDSGVPFGPSRESIEAGIRQLLDPALSYRTKCRERATKLRIDLVAEKYLKAIARIDETASLRRWPGPHRIIWDVFRSRVLKRN